uniref:trypsin n=1 Tax=Salarias fasciatus TaxID=181472 RepID=A0A672H7R1_SALFA
ISVLSSRPWCSLTHNFDRDRKWGFCVPERRRTDDPCRVNPCENGGTCKPIPNSRSFQCVCPESFGGRRCQNQRCYETLHLRHYDPGESWGRIHLRNVEQCACVAGEAACERVRYTGETRFRKHRYRLSSLQNQAECYNSRGAGYRGVVDTTESGARCLAWNSDLLFDELHVGTVADPALRGLGEHAFCRNPDGDRKPWCYTLNDSAISWEYCAVPSCLMPQCESTVQLPLPKPPRPRRGPACGTKHKKRLSVARARILGGSSALPGTHPWMAAIYIGASDFCGGSLISSCWVVSAAHCFFSNPLKSQIRVVLGQHLFNVTDSNSRTFGVEDYVFPRQFSVFNPTLHDIVLIKLKKQDGRCARRTQFIRPICLPDQSAPFPDHYCCAISGWGHRHEKAERYSSLQEGGVRLVNHDDCRKPQVYGNHVTADMVCAGLRGCVDACQGDSGGPLACARGDVSFLYGIVSWGDGCGRTNKPGVYTKVANYIDWINAKIRRKPKAS